MGAGESSNAMLGEKQQDTKILCQNYNLSMHVQEHLRGNPGEQGARGPFERAQPISHLCLSLNILI